MTKIKKLWELFKWLITSPVDFVIGLSKAHYSKRGREYVNDFSSSVDAISQNSSVSNNPLYEYFKNHQEGKGIWKWEHYFEIYHQHLKQYIGQEVHLLEVGVYSGGSIEMWQKYFGKKCYIYGIDIEPSCKKYESDNVKIFIGDQSNREFWGNLKKEIPKIDVLIDDGGHLAFQQIPTLEEMLPHIRPGGLYICEDVHHSNNDFTHYIGGLQNGLNNWNFVSDNPMTVKNSEFQRMIKGIYNYPFVTVIENNIGPVETLQAPRMGTTWEPFFNHE